MGKNMYIHDQDHALSLDEISAYRVNPGLLDFLERKRAESGLRKDQFKILDFGCGRGQSVAGLRRLGWQAHGLEVHDKWIRFAEPGLRDAGVYEPGVLRLGRTAGGPGFEDGFFNVVYSSSVFEHVFDLDAAVGEITRVTAPGGWGYHWFIGRWSPVEGHLGMPLVHWLPKNPLRRWMVAAAVVAGMEPGWQTVAGMGFWQRVKFYYDFSVDQTVYRSVADYRRAFQQAGQRVALDTLNHPRLRQLSGSTIIRIPGGGRLVEAACTAFKTVILSTQKPVSIA